MDKDYILKVKGLYHQFLLGNNKTLQVLKNVSLSAKFDEEDCFFDELLLLASTDHLSYGNRISPQFPILLITDCLFSNYLESPERQYYYNQTIIHKEE